MTVVIDTNVLNGMVGRGHPHGPILDAWLGGCFHWAVSTDIVCEYEETLGRMKGAAKATRLLEFIQAWGARNGTLVEVFPTFRFRTIPEDHDDDKFADCAIAAHAEWIVTEDKHFRPLQGSGFKPQPITPEDFIKRVLGA